ncbi:MAG: hypothetical protein KGV43_02845 [Arcobacter sp.]|nr:hypothetical protein [Arcobacter sp.]
MYKNINLRLSEENFRKLNNIKKKTNISRTELINILISKLDDNNEFLDNEVYSEENTIIKIKLTQTEKEYLQNQSEKSGATSLTNEVKFRLLNTIYKNQFFTNNEMKELSKIIFELNKIGVNINQILKRSIKENIIDSQDLLAVLNDLKASIKNTQNEFYSFIKHTTNRF